MAAVVVIHKNGNSLWIFCALRLLRLAFKHAAGFVQNADQLVELLDFSETPSSCALLGSLSVLRTGSEALIDGRGQ